MDDRFFELRNLKTHAEARLFARQINSFARFIDRKLPLKGKPENSQRIYEILREAHSAFHLRCLAFEMVVTDSAIPFNKKSALIIDLCRLMTCFENLEWSCFQEIAHAFLEKITPDYKHIADCIAVIWSKKWDRRIRVDDWIFWKSLSASNYAPSLCFLTDEFLNLFSNQPLKKQTAVPPAEYAPTSSQIKALEALSWIHKAWQRGITISSITPVTHTLLIGSSGAGKSFIINRFAQELKLPIFSISLGSWMVMGGRGEVPTLRKLANWLKKHPAGLLCLEECEKLNSRNAFSSYTGYIIDEVMSTLDGRVEHFDGWGKDLALALKNHFIVAIATFQDYYDEKIGKDGMHFCEQWEEISIRDRILRQDRLPQELIFRLSSKIIEIAPPTTAEIAERIKAIHKELQLSELTMEQALSVAQKIVKDKKNMRGVEEYALEKWIQWAKEKEKNPQDWRENWRK